jgi:hypothetical protein
MKKIRLSRTELANRLIAISNELDVIRHISNDSNINHYITNISILCDVDKRGYCDEENNRVEKQWYSDLDLSDEEDKRRECVIRTNKDNIDIINQFSIAFEEHGALEQILHYGDYEALMRGVYDVAIALDLKDTECIDNNWYQLFESKKEIEDKFKPRSVSEYVATLPMEEPPTELCRITQTHEFVKDIIAKLKVIDVDGETMQYILKEVGMEEQMHKQLVMDKDFKDTKDLLRQKFEMEL